MRAIATGLKSLSCPASVTLRHESARRDVCLLMKGKQKVESDFVHARRGRVARAGSENYSSQQMSRGGYKRCWWLDG